MKSLIFTGGSTNVEFKVDLLGGNKLTIMEIKGLDTDAEKALFNQFKVGTSTELSTMKAFAVTKNLTLKNIDNHGPSGTVVTENSSTTTTTTTAAPTTTTTTTTP